MTPAKMAEPIKMPFGTWTRVHQRNHVLDDSLDPYTLRDNFQGDNGQEKEPVVDILIATQQSARDSTDMVRIKTATKSQQLLILHKI